MELQHSLCLVNKVEEWSADSTQWQVSLMQDSVLPYETHLPPANMHPSSVFPELYGSLHPSGKDLQLAKNSLLMCR